MRPLESDFSYMTWEWIQQKSGENMGAQMLVKLAKSVGDEPSKLSGYLKIRDWLFELDAERIYLEVLSELQNCFWYLKSVARQGLLNDACCTIKDIDKAT